MGFRRFLLKGFNMSFLFCFFPVGNFFLAFFGSTICSPRVFFLWARSSFVVHQLVVVRASPTTVGFFFVDLRPTVIVREKKTAFLNTIWQALSPGDVKNVLCCLKSYWSIFERNLVGLVDFAGSNFQRMVNWPSFDFLVETGWIARNRPCLLYTSPSPRD